MTPSEILRKHEDANEYHFHEVDRKWIIEAMEEYAALCQPPVMCRFLFQYRSMGKDLMVHIEASSLNDAMVKFATHYHLIDEVYEIAKVS